MELLKEIMINVLEKETLNIVFPDLKINANEIIEAECYKALQKIKAVIDNDSLDDFECVEEIVCIFESLGSNGGNRHDFG